jgi:hypothetical protein
MPKSKNPKLKTYVFAEKNGSGVLIVSDYGEKEAIEYLNDTLKNPLGWRLTETVKED